jgi:hypothetical protein
MHSISLPRLRGRAGWGPGLAIAAILLTACTAASTNTVRYPAYTYSCCIEVNASEIVWHPGQHLTLHWKPQPTTTNEATPYAVVLTLTLTGPFTTVDQLKTTISQNSKPSGVRTIAAPVVTVTDQTGGSPASELDLPPDLPAGYYNLGTGIASGGSSAEAGAVIQILP